MDELDMMSCEWRHREKGGIYEVQFIAIGSGELNGQQIVIYENLNAGGPYARKLAEWHDKMEAIDFDD